MPFPSHLFVPAAVKLALVYPFVYAILNAIQCAPYGELDPLRMRCTCPHSRTGRACETCRIPASRGECLQKTRRCKTKWMGPLCDMCPASGADCDGPCNNTLGWYDSPETTKCRNCTASFHCSGHGVCSTTTGTCICDDGYAGPGYDWSGQDCSRQCPGMCGGPDKGTCAIGGICNCKAPYCGPMCEFDMSTGVDDAYCSDTGFAIMPTSNMIGTRCTCECFTKNGEAVAQGYRCQHTCPVGTNGNICGETGSPASYNGQSCRCSCGDGGALRDAPCDNFCKYGGESNLEGGCTCLFENQLGSQQCTQCKPNWHIPSTGCTQYCNSDITCGAGTCKTDGDTVACTGCGVNRDPIIRTIEVGDAVQVFDSSNNFNITIHDNGLALFDRRKMTATATTSATGDPVWEMSGRTAVMPLGYSAIFNLAIDRNVIAGTRDTVWELLDHIAIPVADGDYVVTRIDATIGYEGAEDICGRMDKCVGFSNTSLYSCMEAVGSELCAMPEVLADDASYAMATHAKLSSDSAALYDLTVQDTLLRGCAVCRDSWFPQPIDAEPGMIACTKQCIPEHTCNGMGTCDKFGHCVCTYPNADPTYGCQECFPNYFPRPDEDEDDQYPGIDPCQNLCIAEAMNDASHTGHYCSGHGVCVKQGICDERCAAYIGAPSSGWSGPHCEFACDSQANETEICSGHGTCVDNRCSCDENHHGKLCDVTCSRPDQYFYVEEDDCTEDSCLPVCRDTDDGCGPCDEDAEDRCTKIRCNGGKCEPTFQYMHHNMTFYYEPCSAELGNDTLQECTAWRDETPEQWAIRNLTSKQVRQQEGIFCDTGARSDNQGFCKRTECKCMHLSTVTIITDEFGRRAVSPSALPLGGEGCQVVGCRSAEFAGAGDYTSFCGAQVPPTIRDPLALYEYGGSFQSELDAELRRVQQHCSHGVCKADAEQPGTTASRPAPPTVQGVRGQCACRGTPDTSKLECLMDSTPHWAKSCCTAALGGDSPYFGRTCMDECICDRNMWWKGSCAGDNPGTMSLGCNCRRGYHSTDDERSALFCGPTCKTQCLGLITADGAPVPPAQLLSDYCPDAVPTSEPYAEGCYDHFLPCNGHGSCAERTGQCYLNDPDRPGVCACWGSQITMQNANPSALLPDNVALYGGDACDVPCPGAGGMADYFNTHYDTLHMSNYLLSAENRGIKFGFYQQYQEKVCSGHGWCDPNAPVTTDGLLQCTCLPNYGGNACDQQCKLDTKAWGDRVPMQLKNRVFNETDPLADDLAAYYGLAQCGPNSMCTDNACVQSSSGRYSRQTYQDALATVARLTQKNVSDADVVDFFEQWALTFVGQFATCYAGYYSSIPLDLGTQGSIYAFDVPPLVRWQLIRSCNAKYSYNTWKVDDGPWCCTYPWEGEAWHDDTPANYVGFTLGGCPDNYCPNFAVGRQCDRCVSNAFTEYNPSSTRTCPSQGSGAGYCAICAGGADEHLVSPFKSLMAADTRTYSVRGHHACERCISHARELSGEQLYYLPSTESRVCNNEHSWRRGKCLGAPNTYSGIANNPTDVTDVTSATESLLCEDGTSKQLQLGLCQCEDGWEGPTCAMPTQDDSCGSGGVLTTIGRVSPHSESGQAYSYCKCKAPEDGSQARTGHYCGGNTVGNIYGFASAELMPCQSIQNIQSGPEQGARVVECNDPTGNSPCDSSGFCQTCAHIDLDPDALCIEYKAVGPGGIVSAHQAQVKARAAC